MFISAQNKYMQPVVKIFDLRNLQSPIVEKSTGFSSGFSLASFDVDTKLLSVTARGSSTLNVIDLNQGFENFQVIQKYSTDTTFQGISSIPKYVLNFDKNEIVRLMKLTSTTLEPICYTIPRRDDRFDPSLYPATRSENSSLSFSE